MKHIIDMRVMPMGIDFLEDQRLAFMFKLRDFDGQDWAEARMVLPMEGGEAPARVQADALEKLAKLALRVADDIRRGRSVAPSEE